MSELDKWLARLNPQSPEIRVKCGQGHPMTTNANGRLVHRHPQDYAEHLDATDDETPVGGMGEDR